MDEPLTNEEIDQAAGVLFPFYDADSDVIYVAGKGDGSIRLVFLFSQFFKYFFIEILTSLKNQKYELLNSANLKMKCLGILK